MDERAKFAMHAGFPQCWCVLHFILKVNIPTFPPLRTHMQALTLHTHMHTHGCTHTHAHTRTCTHTHTHTQKLSSAKRPLILVGSTCLQRDDAGDLLSVVTEMAGGLTKSDSQDWRTLNVLHRVNGKFYRTNCFTF